MPLWQPGPLDSDWRHLWEPDSAGPPTIGESAADPDDTARASCWSRGEVPWLCEPESVPDGWSGPDLSDLLRTSNPLAVVSSGLPEPAEDESAVAEAAWNSLLWPAEVPEMASSETRAAAAEAELAWDSLLIPGSLWS